MHELQFDWLDRLIAGKCKIKFFPHRSGGWSRGGNKFAKRKLIEAMHGMGWIEKIATNNRGHEIYDVSDEGRRAYQRQVDIGYPPHWRRAKAMRD